MMSTDYRFDQPVKFADFKGKIESLGLKFADPDPGEKYDPETHVIITEGENYLHAYTGDGSDTCLVRYGSNDPEAILVELAGEFGSIWSEHDDEYWSGDIEEDAKKAAARGEITIVLGEDGPEIVKPAD